MSYSIGFMSGILSLVASSPALLLGVRISLPSTSTSLLGSVVVCNYLGLF